MIVPVLLVGLALILAYIGTHRNITRLQLLFITGFFAAGALCLVAALLALAVGRIKLAPWRTAQSQT